MIRHFLIGPISNQDGSFKIPVFLDRALFQNISACNIFDLLELLSSFKVFLLL